MDLKKIAKEIIAKSASADEIVQILLSEKGEKYKWAGPDRIWDGVPGIKHAKVVKINRGKGFEEAVKVEFAGGTFIHIGPFDIDTLPTSDRMFLFQCDDSLFIKE